MKVTPITNLNAKAMLVKLTTRRANMSRRDSVAEELIQNTLDDSSLSVISRLFKDKSNPISKLLSAANEVYTFHKKATLPWCDNGPRIIPNAAYFEYAASMKERIAGVDNMLNEVLHDFEAHVARDMLFRSRMQNATSRAVRGDYPTADEFKSKIGFDLRFSPLPDANHFLFDISDEDKKGFEDAINDTARAARNDALARMLSPLRHLVSKLALPVGTPGSIFRDSALQNVVEGCELARKLNIDESPEIEALTLEISRAVTKCVEGKELLREQEGTRAAAVKKLEALANQMGAYMTGM